MKKFILVLLCMMLLFMGGCSIPYTHPIGTWESTNPELTITFPDIRNEENSNTGTIKRNGTVEQVICLFGYDAVVEIFPLSAEHDGSVYDDECYFKGEISWDNDKLLLTTFNSHVSDIPNDTTITFLPQDDASTY